MVVKAPWTVALLALVLIWTVWFIQGPHGPPYSPSPWHGPPHPPSPGHKPIHAPPKSPIAISPDTTAPQSPAKPQSNGAAEISATSKVTPAKVEGDKNAAADKASAAAPKATDAKTHTALAAEKGSDRPLILYAYSDTPNARSNFKFFIAHALHGSADFIFIMNGESNATSLIPQKDNIRIVQRKNDCYDLGAYAEVLTTDNIYKKYQRFVLLNASIRGPFLPSWAGTCWSDVYLRMVTEEVKLVGMTGNCWPQFHVQSMIWATDIVGMELLLNPPNPVSLSLHGDQEPQTLEHGINSCFHTWDQAVHAEVGASQIIRAAGYKLDVMMAVFRSDKDYVEHCDTGGNGDVLWQGKYFGTNVHPFETVFMKTNRDIEPVLIDHLTEWTDKSGYSSYDYC